MINNLKPFKKTKRVYKGIKVKKAFSARRAFTNKQKFTFVTAIGLCAVLIPVAVTATTIAGKDSLQAQLELKTTAQKNPVVESIRQSNLEQGGQTGNNPTASDQKTSDNPGALEVVPNQETQAQGVLESADETTTTPNLTEQTANSTPDTTAQATQRVEGAITSQTENTQTIPTTQEVQGANVSEAPITPQATATPTATPQQEEPTGATLQGAEATPIPSTTPVQEGNEGILSASQIMQNTDAGANPPAINEAQPSSSPTQNPTDASVQPQGTIGGTPQSIPSPTPSPALTPEQELEAKVAQMVAADLKPEANSPFVAEIQAKLMELEYMGEDETTEFYGPVTTNSVSYFQRKHELPITGITDEATLKMLFSPEAKKYTVFLGAEGIDVEELQKRLDELGYSVSVTGYFGTETESAVKYFQRMEGLDPDGNVGSYTRELLYSENAQRAVEAPAKSEGAKKGNTGNSSADRVIEVAKQYLGKPYILGAKGPNAFDCSGFVYYVLNQSGYSIGYMTSAAWAQSGYQTIEGMDNLIKGDIICFKGHVGIYMGNGIMIDSVPSENGVRISTDIRNSDYWTRNFRYGKRVL